MGEHAFQAEVGRVLSLVINSLYSNKEIFLRELVSNSSDALDKLRFRALTEASLMEGDSTLAIRIQPLPEEGVLVLSDNGIGMTESELVENLGTVARSGSQEFLAKLEAGAKKDVSIIGQFGVGFYSAYLVADRVEVVSRAAGTDKAWRWSSTGKETFTIEPAERATRGTEIRLHLKADQKEYLEPYRLRELVQRHSDYIAYPIELVTREKVEEKKDDKGEPKDAAEAKEKSEEKAEAKDKVEAINQARALWQRSKNEIDDAQYDELYRHLTHDFEGPLARTHFRIEGTQEFVGLFFIPKHAPFDLDDPRKQSGVRLFVKRVLIQENADAVLPQWLRFARGLVDSDDLPLNVSRELLQESSVLRTIKKQATKRIVDLLDEMAKDKPDDYKSFWANFGRILKEGLAVDAEHKDRIAALVRFPSTYGDELVSLTDYVSRMKEGQESIYYVTGESKDALAGSPYLEALRANDFEVLLMTDAVDTWAAETLHEFSGKKLENAMGANVKMPAASANKDSEEEKKKALEPLVAAAKEILGTRVREVRLSARLRESAACLVLARGALPAHLEKLLKASGKDLGHGARDFELNPEHALVKNLCTLAAKDAKNEKLRDYVTLLYEQSLVSEGSPLEDPGGFARRVTTLLTNAVAP